MPSLVLSDVAYAFPDSRTLFAGLDLVVGPGLTSLIGRNGAGKSTLLRLAAGELTPSRGSVSVDGEPARPPTVAYLPQLLADPPPGQSSPGRTLADELGVGAALTALDRIEAGEGDDDDFAAVGDDWSVAERTVALLDELGLPTDLGRPVSALSGGERSLAALAGRLLAEPRVLLLDEPTNNLDTRARARLFAALEGFVAGGERVALVVSHDLELLERVATTVELRDGRCRVFGGPYSHHREVVDAEQAAALRALSDARNDLRAEKRDKAEAQVVLARRERYGRKMEATKREPKIVMGKRKREAQESAARYRATHEQGVDRARDRLRAADGAVRREELLRVAMPDPDLPAGRVVLDVEDAAAGRIHLAGPRCVRLAGPNGSGKTTLLRRLLGEGLSGPGDPAGPVRVPWALVPQDVTIARPGATVVDAIRAVRPDAGSEETHAHAARFLFVGDAGFRRLGELSGGERLRAALAARLFASPVPRLLVLDEPTNNLDLDGVEVLADALSSWRGALLLVSHDDGFCERVGVDDVITLA